MPGMNPDLMRGLLFKVESLQDGSEHTFYVSELIREGGIFTGADEMEIRINMMFLFDKKYIVGEQLAQTRFKVERLTADGAEFLETVRDPKVWQKTKDGAAAAGGFTLDLLKALAKGFLKMQVKDRTGLELEF
ncbi:DUF2513 domain-containing protein [Agrobacterium sp. ICMP 7243]|nr:DUF2513 domain-containing protein [Agrobacterium sp. ICMP 7243]